jgi:hypothetical protein
MDSDSDPSGVRRIRNEEASGETGKQVQRLIKNASTQIILCKKLAN